MWHYDLGLPLVVRTWNVFHGNTFPPGRRAFLREMVELVSSGGSGVVCLQELPVWSLRRIESWSGMLAFPAVARSSRLPGPLGGLVTRLHPGLFRSAFAGQANAILVDRSLAAEDLGRRVISVEGVERRVVQVVRVAQRYVVANLHASTNPAAARLELDRALGFAEAFAGADDVVVVAGDFNLAELDLEGYSAPTAGIDHVLVRGAQASEPVVWTHERRERDGLVLSDHAPVEVTIG